MLLPPTATLAEASELLQALQSALAHDTGPLRIDASALLAFDTSAVALLLHARRLSQAAGRAFEIRGAPPQITELARLYGVENLLPLPPPVGPDSSVA